MQSAKAAVKDFLHKDGNHDTTVHESVNPHVTNENVTRTQQHETQQAVDKEVHQHHHHTTVQPIHDKEVLPEKHVHEAAPTEHREHHHGDNSHVEERLKTERAQFQDTRTVGDVQHTQAAAAPVMGSEHHHHHVHETVQPVVHKEVIQPTVVHHTQPIHEVHHNEHKLHGTTTLPAVTMDELKAQGGHLGSHQPRTDAFQGEPNTNERYLGGQGAAGTTSLTNNPSSGQNGRNASTLENNGQSNLAGNNVGNGAGNGVGTGVHNHEHHQHTTTGTTGTEKESLMTKIKKAL